MRLLLPFYLLLTPFAAFAGSDLLDKPAPAFDLPRLTEGRVTSAELRGKPVVLVIGTTQEAAPLCREWMVTLEERFRGSDKKVFQVAVLDNPWYLPKFAVKKKLRTFVPEHGYPLVLIEWKTAFGEAYGIERDDIPRVVVIDRKGIVRAWYVGAMNPSTLGDVLSDVAAL